MVGTLAPSSGLELWGGVECTVNRVGDHYFDQLVFNGHDRRPADVDLFGWLGLKAVRYPILWERTAPDGLARADWRWADARLNRLRELGIRPIVGLVHHGSGPRQTSLLDPEFPARLAEYAGALARRHPFIEDWTPVNEIVTTARFSGLYGHWFPHGRDDRTFVRALLQQCHATVGCMAAVRAVNPRARLVQTDDFGETVGSPGLTEQARHENARRLLAFDLLTGRVDARHPLWGFLRGNGAEEEELAAFVARPCPPDVIGLNYYLTSDRFLDLDLALYPPAYHGGNGRQTYADIETVRAAGGRMAGHERLLHVLWRRYRLPLAITEVHLGGTRDEQVRWLAEAYDAAARARADGVDVRAVTAWALFGSFHWDRLVTSTNGNFEPGVFDVRSDPPRPTLIARALRTLADGETFSHPVLTAPGWWRRRDRPCYPPLARDDEHGSPRDAPMLLITGGGTLARAFARVARRRGLTAKVLCRADLDIVDVAAVARALERWQPWAVVNGAGYGRIDDAEADPTRCHRDNVLGARALAEACRAHGVRLVTFSSDQVFDGRARAPYVESDLAEPLGVYGTSHALAEAEVLALMPSALVVRTAALFGPWDERNFVRAAILRLAAGLPVDAADDVVISPSYLPDLADAALDLLLDDEQGLWHLTNQGAVSWLELGRQTARLGGFDESLVRGRPGGALGFRAVRPSFSALTSERGRHLRGLDEALADLLVAAAASPAASQAGEAS